jgi:hypothetical protein
MKYIILYAMMAFFCSCSDSFINHELTVQKIGACATEVKPIKVTSNINGERYEFEYCLEDGFEVKGYKIERKGDSLVVSFPDAVKNPALYRLVLDIDAKPAYHHILLGNRTVEIVPSQR